VRISVKLLICDDERVLRMLVHAALAPRGYAITEARSGEESIDLARREHPDLIVLDMMMPGRSGLEVLGELRRDPDFVRTPVLMLSARTQAGDMEAAVRAGADRFMAKPFSPLELATVVDEMLASRK
jgi:CheY-like chemotaxis protein